MHKEVQTIRSEDMSVDYIIGYLEERLLVHAELRVLVVSLQAVVVDAELDEVVPDRIDASVVVAGSS